MTDKRGSEKVRKVSQEVREEKRELVTTRTVIRPTGIMELADTTHLTPEPATETIKIDGREMVVVSYTSPDPKIASFKVAYPKELRNTDIFKFTSRLYGYAHTIGVKPDTNEPTTIKLNDFLDWLDYKRDKDNTHDITTKKKVWRAIYNASKTELRTQFTFQIKKGKAKTRKETYIFDKPLINDLIGIYAGGEEIKMDKFREDPPQKIIVRFVNFFITQLQGGWAGSKLLRLEVGEWIPKDAVVTPKLVAGDWQRKYQGYAENLLDYLCLGLKKSVPQSGVRVYPKEELTKRASRIKQPDKAINKMVGFLNLFKKDGHIKDWGFKQTTKGKPLGKTYKKSGWVWIDFTGTPTLEMVRKFTKTRISQDKKDKQRDKKIKDLNERMGELERKNESYGL